VNGNGSADDEKAKRETAVETAREEDSSVDEDLSAWLPDAADADRPSAARMYDYYLGGSHNLAADRDLAHAFLRVVPEMPQIARAQHATLVRMVRYLARAGVTQYLDLGAGIPAVDTVHEVARSIVQDARVVYVDRDPVAVAVSRAILRDVPHALVLRADVRDVRAVIRHRELRGVLDFGRPVALLMSAVLHSVPDEDDPAGIVAGYRDATVPGSYLAVTHATADYRPDLPERTGAVYRQAGYRIVYRPREQIEKFFDGYDLVAPGLVDVINWRPGPSRAHDPFAGDVARYSAYSGLARRQ
jgi:hypothetical protein